MHLPLCDITHFQITFIKSPPTLKIKMSNEYTFTNIVKCHGSGFPDKKTAKKEQATVEATCPQSLCACHRSVPCSRPLVCLTNWIMTCLVLFRSALLVWHLGLLSTCALTPDCVWTMFVASCPFAWTQTLCFILQKHCTLLPVVKNNVIKSLNPTAIKKSLLLMIITIIVNTVSHGGDCFQAESLDIQSYTVPSF